jgi:prepilin-type N-terminal cleavage/methylation domain-containing protein
MKGFTLIEMAIVIFIITILMGISLRFTVFSPENLYLKNFVYKLGSNIYFIRDLSLARREIGSNKACGYGLAFSNNNYFGYVFTTSSIVECDDLASYSPVIFAPSPPLLYIHTNGDIRSQPIEPLQIKENFRSGLSIRISLSSPVCSDNLFNVYPEIALVYYNPYADLLLLGKNNSNWVNLLSSNWQNIFICLQYKNDSRYLKIIRSGQLIVNP